MGSPKKKVHTGRLHKEQINLLKAETELKKLLANLKASHNQLALEELQLKSLLASQSMAESGPDVVANVNVAGTGGPSTSSVESNVLLDVDTINKQVLDIDFKPVLQGDMEEEEDD